MVMLVSGLVVSGSLALVVLALAYVFVVQGAQLKIVGDNIAEHTESIKQKRGQVDDINKVLTVQNQLVSLDTLHASKPISSRIFDYLAKMTPASVIMEKLTVSMTEGAETMTITGSTDTLETINKFTDTLKFTEFTPEGSEESQTVFTEVVLTSFSRDKVGASYTITMKFDPIIFDSENDSTKLKVPAGIITTRSEQGRPILQTELDPQNVKESDEE